MQIQYFKNRNGQLVAHLAAPSPQWPDGMLAWIGGHGLDDQFIHINGQDFDYGYSDDRPEDFSLEPVSFSDTQFSLDQYVGLGMVMARYHDQIATDPYNEVTP